MSKEILVNFNQDMVRAILNGSKTQTRRPVSKSFIRDMELASSIGECSDFIGNDYMTENDMSYAVDFARFQPGDIMCVRERAIAARKVVGSETKYLFVYEADNASAGWLTLPERIKEIKEGNCVPNGCFKELVRIKRKVKRVWFEQIQSISEADAKAEGCDLDWYQDVSEWWDTPQEVKWPCPVCFGKRLHNGINNGGVVYDIDCTTCNTSQKMFANLWDSIYPDTWKENIWVECTEFERCEKP